MVILGLKLGKILLKIAPFAIVAGAAYWFIIRPIQSAAAAPAKALEELSEDFVKGVGQIGDVAGDTVTTITNPESFQRAPDSDVFEPVYDAGAAIQRFFGRT